MLEGVLPVLDATLPGRECWTFGGGTALAVQLDHRISYDIDIFLESSRHLRSLTPARNEAMRAFLGGHRYQWPGHYLKLELDGGEIDFISSAPVTDLAPQPLAVGDGTTVQMEPKLEIAAKKAFYRASDFKTRDVFDFAAHRGAGPAGPCRCAPGPAARPAAAPAGSLDGTRGRLCRKRRAGCQSDPEWPSLPVARGHR